LKAGNRCCQCGRFKSWDKLRLVEFTPDNEFEREDSVYECADCIDEDKRMDVALEKLDYEEYAEGFIAGLECFAWWKDGTQYVGTCGMTLQRAIELFAEGKLHNQRKKPQ